MRVRDDHGAWARAPSTDTADPDADTNAGDAVGVPPVGPTGTGTRAQGSREGRQAPTPGREGATEGEPSRRAHAAPAVEGGPDGTAGGPVGGGGPAPDPGGPHPPGWWGGARRGPGSGATVPRRR